MLRFWSSGPADVRQAQPEQKPCSLDVDVLNLPAGQSLRTAEKGKAVHNRPTTLGAGRRIAIAHNQTPAHPRSKCFLTPGVQHARFSSFSDFTRCKRVLVAMQCYIAARCCECTRNGSDCASVKPAVRSHAGHMTSGDQISAGQSSHRCGGATRCSERDRFQCPSDHACLPRHNEGALGCVAFAAQRPRSRRLGPQRR